MKKTILVLLSAGFFGAAAAGNVPVVADILITKTVEGQVRTVEKMTTQVHMQAASIVGYRIAPESCVSGDCLGTGAMSPSDVSGFTIAIRPMRVDSATGDIAADVLVKYKDREGVITQMTPGQPIATPTVTARWPDGSTNVSTLDGAQSMSFLKEGEPVVVARGENTEITISLR